MATADKEIGLIGLGPMGQNIAKILHNDNYSLVLYNRTKEKYDSFSGMDNVYLSKDIQDFVGKLRGREKGAIVWMMVPAGPVTNNLVSELSKLLRKEDIVIDASNSIYTDSIENYKKLNEKGIFYLDVGCAGGPGDLLKKGVSLMIGGDKVAFERARDVFSVVAGKGEYGYLGNRGAGHMTKMPHNDIFYSIFPAYAEAIELLVSMKEKEPDMHFDMKEALRLLKSAPPITTDIMEAIAETYEDKLPDGDVPEIKIADMVKHAQKRAEELGVSFSITNSILKGYPTMSKRSRKTEADAKKKITGH